MEGTHQTHTHSSGTEPKHIHYSADTLSVSPCLYLCFVSPTPITLSCLHLCSQEVRREQLCHSESVRRVSEGRERWSVDGGAEISIAARLQIHGKNPPHHHPPHTHTPMRDPGSNSLSLLWCWFEERETDRERERVMKRKKGGREGGGEGEQVVQTVESYISSPRLLGRIYFIYSYMFYIYRIYSILWSFFYLKAINYVSSWESSPSVKVQAWSDEASTFLFYHDLGNAGM